MDRRGMMRGARIGALVAVTALVAAATGAGAGGPNGLGDPQDLSVAASGVTGIGRIDPGRDCAEGGAGGTWHYAYESTLPDGVISGLGQPSGIPDGDLRLAVDLHSEHHQIRTDPEPGTEGPDTDSAFLLANESRVALVNQRGMVRLALTSGDCDAPTLDFDGLHASAADPLGASSPHQWQIIDANGAYRDAEGAGSFQLEADVEPGADNAFSLVLDGDIAVLQPDLETEVVDTYWGFLGVHYLLRIVTVVYEVTNVGPGDAFGVRLVGASSPTPGTSLLGPIFIFEGNNVLGPVPQSLGDLGAGESVRIVLRWQLPLPAGDPPCQLVILGCEFDNTLDFDVPDALDVVGTDTATVHVVAPDLPPPLS